MEIKFRTKQKSKVIDIDNSILSIQTTDVSLIDNLIEDYDVAVVDNKSDYFVSDTVLNEITSYNKYPELQLVYEVSKTLELDEDFMDKEIVTLSRTERYFLELLRNISKLNKIILFKDLFLGLDLNMQKKLMKVINFLKSKNYIVIICSSDVDFLYKNADYSLICNKFNIKYDKTDKIYSDVKMLTKYKLDVPTLSYITYKAKEEKNVKLFYSKDVRDIIKDIYKHV